MVTFSVVSVTPASGIGRFIIQDTSQSIVNVVGTLTDNNVNSFQVSRVWLYMFMKGRCRMPTCV